MAETFGPFECLLELGRGAQAVVHLARDTRATEEKYVALKRPLESTALSDEHRRRFRNEAKTKDLRHPNLAAVLEADEVDGCPYLVLPYFPGVQLKEWLAVQCDPPTDRGHEWAVVQMMYKVARAVAVLHEKKITHRDLNPANILLAAPEDAESEIDFLEWPLHKFIPQVIDFGLIRQVDEFHGVTKTGDVLGTPYYRAPEQEEGNANQATPAADVFSLGVMLYELLTGRCPFGHTTFKATSPYEPPPVTEMCPFLHPDLDFICRKCLNKNPNSRYADANALADDLQRFMDHRRPAWPRRKRVAASATVILAAMAAVFLALFWQWPGSSPRDLSKAHDGDAFCVAYTSDGEFLASGGKDNAVRLWDAKSGKEIATLSGHTQPVRSVAFAPGGSVLASAADDGTVRIWDVAGRKPLRTLQINAPVLSLTFDGDDLFAAGSFDRVLRWTVSLSKVVEQQPLRNLESKSVAWMTPAQDGKRLGIVGVEDVPPVVWLFCQGNDPRKDTEWVPHVPKSQTTRMAWSPEVEPKFLAVGNELGEVSLRNGAAPYLQRRDGEWKAHEKAVRSLIWLPGKSSLISAGADGTICLWHLTERQSKEGNIEIVRQRRDLLTVANHAIWQLALSPDAQTLAVAESDGHIQLLPLTGD